ncbi:MAG: ABC transporter permease [Clostridiales bacterium]|nr:ABC transporter permease [Clostridiales bacterium]MDR2749275.1 ABC transporter permease [Clostridiales bacterium]
MKRFSLLSISVSNITCRAFRSGTLAGIVFILSFVLVCGSLFSACLRNGISSIDARLGADLLLVPSGYEQSAQGALLRGEPSSFYFEPKTVQLLLALPDVSEITPQLFIASFDSPHCSAQVQMIGYDPETDFLLSPWLNNEVPGGPGADEVIVGSKINGDVGDKLTFFARQYTVAGKLAETGMGFDTSAFVNMDMAQVALGEYIQLGGKDAPEGDGAASCIAINANPGTNLRDYSKNLRIAYSQHRVAVIETQTMLADLSSNLDTLLGIVSVLAVFLWILASTVLALIFAMSLNERRREFGIYRALGVTKSKLAAMMLTESALLSAPGAFLGLALSSVLYFMAEPLISVSMNLPYLRPNVQDIALILAGGFLVSLVTGPLAALFSAARIGKVSTAAIIKEGA